MIAHLPKSRCTIFAQFFVHFETKPNPCVIVSGGEGKLRKNQVGKLRATTDNLLSSLEEVEQQMQSLNEDSETDRKLRRLARLIYVGQPIEEKILEGNIMRQMSFEAIEKRLAKKNAELVEVRNLRKKLADREKNICADIESLQNQKVEVIFLKVKREIKNEKLDVTSGSVLPLLKALRSSQHSVAEASSAEKIDTQADDSVYDAERKIELDFAEKVDPVSKITETERAINEGR